MKAMKQLFCNHEYGYLEDYYKLCYITHRVCYLELIMLHKCSECGKIRKTKRTSQLATVGTVDILITQAERDGFIDEWTAIKRYGIK